MGVDILFWALVVLVVGSFTGTYLGVAHEIPASLNFYLGHQGYEFIELGRVWQWIEYIGILFLACTHGAQHHWCFQKIKGIKTLLLPLFSPL